MPKVDNFLYIFHKKISLTIFLNALKCVKTQELFRPEVKNYGSIDFTLTYNKCGID